MSPTPYSAWHSSVGGCERLTSPSNVAAVLARTTSSTPAAEGSVPINRRRSRRPPPLSRTLLQQGQFFSCRPPLSGLAKLLSADEFPLDVAVVAEHSNSHGCATSAVVDVGDKRVVRFCRDGPVAAVRIPDQQRNRASSQWRTNLLESISDWKTLQPVSAAQKPDSLRLFHVHDHRPWLGMSRRVGPVPGERWPAVAKHVAACEMVGRTVRASALLNSSARIPAGDTARLAAPGTAAARPHQNRQSC